MSRNYQMTELRYKVHTWAPNSVLFNSMLQSLLKEVFLVNLLLLFFLGNLKGIGFEDKGPTPDLAPHSWLLDDFEQRQ